MKVDKDDNSGAGSAGDEKAPPSGAGHEDLGDFNPLLRRKPNGKQGAFGPVERIRALLGPRCVLLAVPLGEKGCKTLGWERLREADMTRYYLAALNHDKNIGVSLGRASGDLISIDFDSDELLEEFLTLNPAFRESLISKSGARGGNVWLRIEGEYPRSGVLRIDGEDVGEWRANGNQTVIYGKHPDGCFYSDNGKSPIRIEFSAIRWPERMTLPWVKKSHDGEIKRPGVSAEFLRARGVRHVEAEEAKALLGFRPRGGGLWIAYPSFGGGEGPLMVNGREYGRLRLDKPSGDTKYLAARESGAQLYVPCGPLFEKELVICEGEFKALSLCEAGIRAVAVGGVSSAMSGGRLIADLEKLLPKFPAIRTVYFLGDGDTALNFEFSREAVKLARALPDGVELRLPRIPIGGRNGIDDCREEFGGEFQAFWEGIQAEAVEVGVEMDMSTLAAELLVRELPAIGKAADGKKKCQGKIVKLAGRLGPLALDEVAQAVKEHLGIGVGPFKEEVARARGASAVFAPRDDKEAKVMAEWGAPYSQGPHGEVLINEKFFAASFASRYRVLFEVTEGRFYLYSEESGAWCHTNAAIIKKMISSDWHEFARREKLKELDRKGSSGCISAICEHLKNHVATKGAFKPLLRDAALWKRDAQDY
jgi:Domain of unknown function (DUF3854)